MTAVSMHDKLAVMAQADVVVTVPGGTFTMPATTPFTSCSGFIDVPAGTVLAVMEDSVAPKGKILQVFSIDYVMTVA